MADLIDRQALAREEDFAGFLNLQWIGGAQLVSLLFTGGKALSPSYASAFGIFTIVLIRNARALSQYATPAQILSCVATRTSLKPLNHLCMAAIRRIALVAAPHRRAASDA
jgi:hypothetical protein